MAKFGYWVCFAVVCCGLAVASLCVCEHWCEPEYLDKFEYSGDLEPWGDGASSIISKLECWGARVWGEVFECSGELEHRGFRVGFWHFSVGRVLRVLV